MTIRYDRETTAACNLTGGSRRVHFPAGVTELSLDPGLEAELVDSYEQVEYASDADAELADLDYRELQQRVKASDVDVAANDSRSALISALRDADVDGSGDTADSESDNEDTADETTTGEDDEGATEEEAAAEYVDEVEADGSESESSEA